MNQPPTTQPQYPQPTFPQQQWQDDEIDLRELFKVIWKGKWLILLMGFGFAFAGLAYALLQPNVYRSEAVLVPQESGNSGGLGALGGQLGGLASLAGINVRGGGSSRTEVALKTLESRVFLADFINRHDLKPGLFAVQGWNGQEGIDGIEWDVSIYNPETDSWQWDGRDQPPTDQEAIRDLRERLQVSQARDTSFVTVAVEHVVPYLTQQWVALLIQDINLYMKEQDMAEAQSNLEYLENQLSRTSLTGMQQVFFSLIEEQTKNLMLAEAQAEYALKVIDPPVVPEEKSGPKRALIVIVAGMLGGMLSLFIIFVRHAFRREDDPEKDLPLP